MLLGRLAFPLNGQMSVEELLAEGYLECEEESIEEFREYLDAFLENPVNWNSCGADDLLDLPLPPELKVDLIRLKRRNLRYADWESFQRDLSFTTEQMGVIRLFISLENRGITSLNWVNYVALKRNGASRDIGRNMSRLRMRTLSGCYAGLVVERDENEIHICDYGNVTFRSPLIGKRLDLTAGAYRLQWGQGLLFSASLMGSKSSDALRNLQPRRDRITNYSGTDENRFLFGAALNLRVKEWEVRPFYSRHRLDAEFEEDGTARLISSGIHASDTQLQHKNALREQMLGAALVKTVNRGSFGVLLFQAAYDAPLTYINGRNRYGGLSVMHNFTISELSLSGELACLGGARWGVVQSIRLNLGNAQLGIGGRYISPSFFAPFGSPLRKYAGFPRNEKGLYAGMQLRLGRGWSLSGYADLFSRIESDEVGEPPAQGNEVLVGLRKNFGKGTQCSIRIKRCANESSGSAERFQPSHALSANGRTRLTKNLRLNGRLGYSWREIGRVYSEGLGFSGYADIDITSQNRLTLGCSHFYTDTFEDRVYIYEPGIPLRFGIAMFNGTGYHFFMVDVWRLAEGFELALAVKMMKSRTPDDHFWNKNNSLEFQLIVDL